MRRLGLPAGFGDWRSSGVSTTRQGNVGSRCTQARLTTARAARGAEAANPRPTPAARQFGRRGASIITMPGCCYRDRRQQNTDVHYQDEKHALFHFHLVRNATTRRHASCPPRSNSLLQVNCAARRFRPRLGRNVAGARLGLNFIDFVSGQAYQQRDCRSIIADATEGVVG